MNPRVATPHNVAAAINAHAQAVLGEDGARISQAAVARAVGMKPQKWSLYVRGLKAPSVLTVTAWLKAWAENHPQLVIERTAAGVSVGTA